MSGEVAEFFNALAPSWDDRADDDLSFVDGLLSALPIQPGDRLLDLGCGTGVITGLLHQKSHAPVVGMDVSSKMIDIAKRKYVGNEDISFICADFLEAEGHHAYDGIVIYNAYPHFVDVETLVQKLEENLTPKGYFAIVHSLSRQKINAHHEGLRKEISRDLEAPAEEAKRFVPSFDVLRAKEGDDHYLLVGRKRVN